jgi:hypothetical protein
MKILTTAILSAAITWMLLGFHIIPRAHDLFKLCMR